MLKREPKPNMTMWNGVDIEKYISSWPNPCLEMLHKVVKRFKLDPKMEEAISWIRDAHKKRSSQRAREVGKGWVNPHSQQEASCTPKQPVGMCPKCKKGWVYGMRLPVCEQKKTGRITYKECGSCGYYAEIFRKGPDLIEIEGEQHASVPSASANRIARALSSSWTS